MLSVGQGKFTDKIISQLHETNHKNFLNLRSKFARSSTPPDVNVQSTATPDNLSIAAWLSQYLVED